MLVMLTELLSGLALFLFGMKFMSEGLQKAAGDKMRVILDRVTKNRFIAVFFGAIFTAIIQSSGATTVMEVSFVNAGLLTLEQSVGITFGANIGTTITAQLVSLKLTAIAPYIIFVGACLMMFGNKPITRKISDTTFKVFQTIIFLPFASQFVKLTKLLIPGNKEGEEEDNGLHLEYIRKASSKFVTSTAVVEIIQEIERMAGLARENLVASMEALADKNLDKAKEINAREKIIDYLSSEITDYLVEVNRYELPLADSRRIGALFHVVIDLERIGDHAINILENAEKRSKLNEKFTGAGKEELTTMYKEVLELFDKSMEMFVTNKKDNIDQIIDMENDVDQMQIDYQNQQVKRLSKGICGVEIGLIFTDMVIGLERIADHSTNIAYSIFHENPEDAEEQ